MGETERQAGLELCRTCRHLRGPFHDSFNHCERVQPCRCDPDQPRWNGYDYNCAAELCHCCAADVVTSGSKWSPFFCNGCKDGVRAYNESIGFCVIPLGRHSLMNGVALPAAAAAKPGEAARFAKGLVGFIGRLDRLSTHRRGRIGQVLESLSQRTGAISVPTYLARAKAASSDRDVVFAALVSAMTEQGNG